MPVTADYHQISTEPLDEPEGHYAWHVECTCGWTRYCASAEEVQIAIASHRGDLAAPPDGI